MHTIPQVPPVPVGQYNPQAAHATYWNLMNHNWAQMHQDPSLYPPAPDFPPMVPPTLPRTSCNTTGSHGGWMETDPWTQPERTEEPHRDTVSTNRNINVIDTSRELDNKDAFPPLDF